MNYIGQIFGNRKVVSNECSADDFTRIGLHIPVRIDKYKLTECLNCGSILPCEISNLRRQPPKRCVFCSNIGNHSQIETNTNNWVAYDNYAVCNILYNGQVVSTYIDLDWYEKVKEYTWRIVKKRQKFYVITGSFKKGTAIYMHSLIYGAVSGGYEVDHIDGNSLNNRRCNLREVTHQENVDNQRATRIDNQIGIRGIVYNKAGHTYKVDFYFHGKRFYTKEWKTLNEAVWCRFCFENAFGLTAIKNNPLAEQYYNLEYETKEDIKQYVQQKILGNER